MRFFALAALVACVLLASTHSVSAAPGEFTHIRSLARFFDIVLDKDGDGAMSQKEVRCSTTPHCRPD